MFGLFQKFLAKLPRQVFSSANASTNLTRRCPASAVIYLLDPIKDIPNLYMHRQFQSACKNALASLSITPQPPLPTPTTCTSLLMLRYVTVTCDMAQCFCSVFCKNCRGFLSGKTHQGKEKLLSIEYIILIVAFLLILPFSKANFNVQFGDQLQPFVTV